MTAFVPNCSIGYTEFGFNPALYTIPYIDGNTQLISASTFSVITRYYFVFHYATLSFFCRESFLIWSIVSR
jgi:hypothetical protein